MRRLPIAVLILLVAGCGRGPDPAAPHPQGDPLLAAALFDPIASDPDLAAQNRANAVASLPALDRSIPSLDLGPEAVSRARADALALIGGLGELRRAPAAGTLPTPMKAELGACAARLEQSAAWAARLPDSFPVYPRGAVQEAAGSDSAGCAVRLVTFQTPVSPGEVLDFYYSRAVGAGISPEHLGNAGADVLRGAKGTLSFIASLRRLPSGATEVQLVTRG